jgi:hypothetical protein
MTHTTTATPTTAARPMQASAIRTTVQRQSGARSRGATGARGRRGVCIAEGYPRHHTADTPHNDGLLDGTHRRGLRSGTATSFSATDLPRTTVGRSPENQLEDHPPAGHKERPCHEPTGHCHHSHRHRGHPSATPQPCQPRPPRKHPSASSPAAPSAGCKAPHPSTPATFSAPSLARDTTASPSNPTSPCANGPSTHARAPCSASSAAAETTHRSCANGLHYPLRWRSRTLAIIESRRPSPHQTTLPI